MMKKSMALFLSLLLLSLALPACALTASDVTGSWYLSAAVIDGEEVNPVMLGTRVSMELKADGSAVLVANGSTTIGSWVLHGSDVMLADAGGNVSLLVYVDGQLRMENNGGRSVFTREEPAAFRIPQPMMPESIEQFYGVWEGSFMYSGATVRLLSQMGIQMSIRIDSTGLYEIYEEGDVGPYPIRMADGGIYVLNGVANQLMQFCLNEDNTISLLNDQGSVCFIRVGDVPPAEETATVPTAEPAAE